MIRSISFINLKITFGDLLVDIPNIKIYGYFAEINPTDCITYYLQDISVYLRGCLRDLVSLKIQGLVMPN